MSISREMSGSPWHKERVHRAEGDDRRYKGRCRYFNYDEGTCLKNYGKCIGSAHCNEYTAISEEEFKSRQARQAQYKKKNTADDETYWY